MLVDILDIYDNLVAANDSKYITKKNNTLDDLEQMALSRLKTIKNSYQKGQRSSKFATANELGFDDLVMKRLFFKWHCLCERIDNKNYYAAAL